MRFPGLLQVPGTAGQGVRIVLELDDDLLTLGYRDGIIGTWPLEEVTVAQQDDSRFVFSLGEERIDFVTYDPVALVSEALPAIEAAQGRLRRGGRWPFGRKHQPDDPVSAPARDPEPPPPVRPEPEPPRSETLEVRVDEGLTVKTAAPTKPRRLEPEPALVGAPDGLLQRVRQAGNPFLELLGVRPAVPEHPHEFTTHRLPGDLVRRVCSICGHVSVGLG